MKHIRVYMHNGISPSPQVSYKFDSPNKNEINGSEIVNRVIGKMRTEGTGNSSRSSHVAIQKYLLLQEKGNQIGSAPHSSVTLFMCLRVKFILVST